MKRTEAATDVVSTHREGDYQRWADDGGLTPDPEGSGAEGPLRSPATGWPGMPVRLVYLRPGA